VNKPPRHPPSEPEPVPDADPDAPPSEEELVQSDALRRALEDPSQPNEAAELARAVSLAHAPRPLDAEGHRAILEKALAVAQPGPREAARATRRRSGTVIRVSFGAAAALVMAAGVALVVGNLAQHDEAASAVSVAPPTAKVPFRARSTQPLFDEPFEATVASSGVAARPRPSGGSARIDRIAMARAGDFRENEFSRWGAR